MAACLNKQVTLKRNLPLYTGNTLRALKTLAELKKAANKIMAELRKTKPLVVGKATPPKAVVKPKKRSATKAVAKKRHAFKPGRKDKG